MKNWISLSWSPGDYGEYSFLQRQNSAVNENLGFRGNQSSIQGDFSENASLCLQFLRCKMVSSGLNTNLTNWLTPVGFLELGTWILSPWLFLCYPSPPFPLNLIYRPALPHSHTQQVPSIQASQHWWAMRPSTALEQSFNSDIHSNAGILNYLFPPQEGNQYRR